MKRLLLLLPFLLAAPALAQAPGTYIIKDSIYFTMDDGIQSPEEMEEEAEYVQGLCAGNPYQSLYFDCECLGGAFLQKRETLGPIVPQNEILYTLTKSKKAVCGNSAEIAGSTYKFCKKHVSTRQELATEKENEEYCRCAANKVAIDFGKRPRLDITYIRNTKSYALSYCRNPQNRVNVPGTKTSNSQ
jgi:hypothetical protein